MDKFTAQNSRIKGMRRKIFSPFVMFVLIFPLVGLTFILFGLKRSIRALRLLKHGVMTKGVLISKTRTNTKVNGRVVYKMTFRYMDDQGTEYIREERTHDPYFLKDQKEEKDFQFSHFPTHGFRRQDRQLVQKLIRQDKAGKVLDGFVFLVPGDGKPFSDIHSVSKTNELNR